MNLSYFGIEKEIEFEGVVTLVIENANLFRNMKIDMYNQANNYEGNWNIFNKGDFYEISKKIIFIDSIFNLEEQSKNIISEVIREMKKQIEQEKLLEYNKLQAEILEFINNCLINYSVDIETSTEIDITNLIKLANLNIKSEIAPKSILETILSYLINIKKYLGKNYICFCNIKGYFNQKEWDTFCKEIKLNEINILCIESGDRNILSKDENKIIIDEELCEIY